MAAVRWSGFAGAKFPGHPGPGPGSRRPRPATMPATCSSFTRFGSSSTTTAIAACGSGTRRGFSRTRTRAVAGRCRGRRTTESDRSAPSSPSSTTSSGTPCGPGSSRCTRRRWGPEADRGRPRTPGIRTEPARARREIAKHVDGDPVITPLMTPEGHQEGCKGRRRAVISGRVTPHQNSLLAGEDQEAVFVEMVAGAGFEPATFGL
jgi:hypothetical protein